MRDPVMRAMEGGGRRAGHVLQAYPRVVVMGFFSHVLIKVNNLQETQSDKIKS